MWITAFNFYNHSFCILLLITIPGRSRSENVGLSNKNIGENPIPQKPEGSSAEGKSGPKARLKSVVDGRLIPFSKPAAAAQARPECHQCPTKKKKPKMK